MQGFIGGGDIPDEVREELERRQMEALDEQNQMWDFLLTLPPEQLMLIQNLCVSAIHDKTYVHRLLGIITGIFRLQHGDRCGGCGKNHDADILDEAANELQAEGNDTKQADLQEASLKDAHDAAMFAYNLEGAQNNMVRCKGCGLIYPSLEDRMMRGVNDCHGCHIRSAHG